MWIFKEREMELAKIQLPPYLGRMNQISGLLIWGYFMGHKILPGHTLCKGQEETRLEVQ